MSSAGAPPGPPPGDDHEPHPLDAAAPPAGGEAGRTASASAAALPTAVVLPRWIQLVLLPLALLGAWALVRAAGPVVLIFVIGGLIALLLNPFVSLLRRLGVPRGLSVLTVYLAVAGTLAGVGMLLAEPIGDQVSAFRTNLPDYIDGADDVLADVQAWLDERDLALEVAEPGRTALQTLGDRLAEGSGSIVDFTRHALTTLVEGSIAVILVIVISIYMLLYGERIGGSVRRVMPAGDGTPEDDFPTRIQKAVFGYVRGQLAFSTIMGASAGLMLYVLGSVGIFEDGKRYAVFFGAFYGAAELIPYIGPAIGAAPPVLIALFGSEPLDAVWLTIAFIALQQIEGHIVAPNVFAQALRINPLLVIFALLLGHQLYGLLGAFIALPIAAMLRETVVYLRRHVVLEPWPVVAADVAGTGAGLTAPPADPGGTCPECGAAFERGAAFCPACGTELPEPGAQAAASSAAPG